MFNSWINVLTNEIKIYGWINVTQISHLLINSCFKHVFNTYQYQCVKCTNYEWTNFAHFLLLSCEMLSLWCCANGINSQIPFLTNDAYSSSMETCHDETSRNWIVMWKVWSSMNPSKQNSIKSAKEFWINASSSWRITTFLLKAIISIIGL